MNDVSLSVRYRTVRLRTVGEFSVAGLLANDVPPAGTTYHFLDLTQPAHGTITGAGPFDYSARYPFVNLLYRADEFFSGEDTFTYRIYTGSSFSGSSYSGSGASNVSQPVTVHIDVRPNSTPVAIDDAYTVPKGGVLTVPASTGLLRNDTDADSDPLQVALVVTDHAHGKLDWSIDGRFVYTPDANYTGSDSFTYRISDGRELSNFATVRLTVERVEVPPPIVVTPPAIVPPVVPVFTVVTIPPQEPFVPAIVPAVVAVTAPILPSVAVTAPAASVAPIPARPESIVVQSEATVPTAFVSLSPMISLGRSSLQQVGLSSPEAKAETLANIRSAFRSAVESLSPSNTPRALSTLGALALQSDLQIPAVAERSILPQMIAGPFPGRRQRGIDDLCHERGSTRRRSDCNSDRDIDRPSGRRISRPGVRVADRVRRTARRRRERPNGLRLVDDWGCRRNGGCGSGHEARLGADRPILPTMMWSELGERRMRNLRSPSSHYSSRYV